MWMGTITISALLLFPKIMGFPQFYELNSPFASHFDKLWPLVAAWIILSCHYGYSSKVNRLLSLPIWMPFEHIGLSLYLIHPYIIAGSVISNKQPIDFDGGTKVIESIRINCWVTEHSFQIFLDFWLLTWFHNWFTSKLGCSSLYWKAVHCYCKARFKKLVKKNY